MIKKKTQPLGLGSLGGSQRESSRSPHTRTLTRSTSHRKLMLTGPRKPITDSSTLVASGLLPAPRASPIGHFPVHNARAGRSCRPNAHRVLDLVPRKTARSFRSETRHFHMPDDVLHPDDTYASLFRSFYMPETCQGRSVSRFPFLDGPSLRSVSGSYKACRKVGNLPFPPCERHHPLPASIVCIWGKLL